MSLINRSFFIMGLYLLTGSVYSQTILSNDVETDTLNTIFDVNQYGGIGIGISEDVAHSGTKSIKLSYTKDEQGVELRVAPFAPTVSLYTRKYEYYSSSWAKNWPIGLKTSRFFTKSDFTAGPQPTASAYMSEKLIWQSYNATCQEDFAYGLNNAVYDLDLKANYQPSQLFKNGLPYIRTNHWYKYETWMVLNSGVDVPDGVLKVWIDDVLVYSNVNLKFKSSTRGVPNGTGWQTMWFGGNYSGGPCGDPSAQLDRYIDDVYLSTTLDRKNPSSPVQQ